MATRDRYSQIEELVQQVCEGQISRRGVLMRAAALGLAAPAVASLLAACGSDDDDDDEAATDGAEPTSAAESGAAPTATSEAETGDATVTEAEDSAAAPTETVASPSVGDIQMGGMLVYAWSGDPCTLDPHVNSCTSNSQILHCLFDYLIERAPDGTLHPGLATEWSVADDEVTWTFKLREGVTFHDGTPFNAEAVVFNFDRIVDPETKSEYAVFAIGPYESSRAIDEYTVEVTMSEPYGVLPVSLATWGMAMMSPAAVEEHGDQIGQNPVGTGPFMFKEWAQQSHFTFVRNPDYNWPSSINNISGPAPVEEIEFRIISEAATVTAALLAGEVDVAQVGAADFSSFEENGDYRIQKSFVEGYPPVGDFINVDRPPTDDVRVRKALCFGVDRQELNDVIMEGHAMDADSVMSPFSWAYDPATALYDYDPDQAGTLLDEAGWVMGDGEYRQKDGEELKIVHLALSGVKSTAELVQAQLKRIGVNVELLVQDNPAQQQSGQQGVHNLVWTQWSGVDPADLWKIYQSDQIGSGWNFAHYNNPKVDQLFQDGVATNDLEERKAIYSELAMVLMDDATFIPFYNLTRLIAMKKKVQGTDVFTEQGAGFRMYNFWLSEE